MIPQGVQRYLSFLIAFTIVGCSQPDASGSSTTATVNLAKASETKTIECEAAFAVGVEESEKATDGSTWTWLKAKDGTISQYCRRQVNGVVTAWDEASRQQKATHSLVFQSNPPMTRFATIRD